MLYAIYCLDKSGSLEIRLGNRPTHLAYLESQGDKLVTAGPLLSEDGQTPLGSLLVFEADSPAEAEAFAAGDPYAIAGLFASVTIRPWRRVFPKA
ncbi:MAG: YciI family protein [Rhodospirillaceae bacterium]